MKKIIFTAFLGTFCLLANAQVLHNDLLNGYSPGDVLEKAVYAEKEDPININTWSRAYTSKPLENVSSPTVGIDLTYPGYAENGPSIELGSGFAPGTRGRRATVYSLTDGKKYGDRSSTFYLSFLVNFSQVQSTSLTELIATSTVFKGGGNRGTIYVRKDGNNQLRFAVSLINDRVETTQTYDMNETHLVVLKIDYKKQEASLFINPSLDGTEPTPVAVADPGTGELKHAIRAISLTNSNSYKGNIGNFRFSRGWAAAIGQTN